MKRLNQISPRSFPPLTECPGITEDEWINEMRAAEGLGPRPHLPPLDAVVDKVLSHKPKPKSKPARKRARRAKKIAQAADV
jgi:hypothetical protein